MKINYFNHTLNICPKSKLIFGYSLRAANDCRSASYLAANPNQVGRAFGGSIFGLSPQKQLSGSSTATDHRTGDLVSLISLICIQWQCKNTLSLSLLTFAPLPLKLLLSSRNLPSHLLGELQTRSNVDQKLGQLISQAAEIYSPNVCVCG